MPYCRDPSQPVPKLPPDDVDKPEEPVIPDKEPTKRPAVYKKKPGHAPSSYYQPPEPWSGTCDDTEILENSAPKLKKKQSRSLYAIDRTELQNPIKELQAMARSTNDMNEDDPPFNFQAMLKKTPKNRASMKRLGELDNGTAEKTKVSKPQIPEPQINVDFPPESPPKVVSKPPQAKKEPKSSPQREYVKEPITSPQRENVNDLKASPQKATVKQPKTTPKETPPTPPPNEETPTPPKSMNREMTRQNSKDLIISVLKKRDSKPELFYPIIDNKEYEKVELAPGITIEGIVTEL